MVDSVQSLTGVACVDLNVITDISTFQAKPGYLHAWAAMHGAATSCPAIRNTKSDLERLRRERLYSRFNSMCSPPLTFQQTPAGDICIDHGKQLLQAAMLSDEQKVDGLVSMRADLSVRSPTGGSTALHYAALHGHAVVVSRLLEARASSVVADDKGWTPLHTAASRGHVDTVVRLLTSGAIALMQTKDNKTAKDLALSIGRQTSTWHGPTAPHQMEAMRLLAHAENKESHMNLILSPT
eukprot:gnl/TRDRNA2_/TRDRNA2_159735_c3_seq1.p2 gnl/TRDRNA2_/TRDRNA2_159735_c3~~gnl/TRDRNA2_/TRDRNA2_159735_c3_seq1.p2  ORF type:complete len:239 (+),score=30.74 gnl/TRDRNA2_/TRDRNA2_159735_c3_seq1:929-1645(+)